MFVLKTVTNSILTPTRKIIFLHPWQFEHEKCLTLSPILGIKSWFPLRIIFIFMCLTREVKQLLQLITIYSFVYKFLMVSFTHIPLICSSFSSVVLEFLHKYWILTFLIIICNTQVNHRNSPVLLLRFQFFSARSLVVLGFIGSFKFYFSKVK